VTHGNGGLAVRNGRSWPNRALSRRAPGLPNRDPYQFAKQTRL